MRYSKMSPRSTEKGPNCRKLCETPLVNHRALIQPRHNGADVHNAREVGARTHNRCDRVHIMGANRASWIGQSTPFSGNPGAGLGASESLKSAKDGK